MAEQPPPPQNRMGRPDPTENRNKKKDNSPSDSKLEELKKKLRRSKNEAGVTGAAAAVVAPVPNSAMDANHMHSLRHSTPLQLTQAPVKLGQVDRPTAKFFRNAISDIQASSSTSSLVRPTSGSVPKALRRAPKVILPKVPTLWSQCSTTTTGIVPTAAKCAQYASVSPGVKILPNRNVHAPLLVAVPYLVPKAQDIPKQRNTVSGAVQHVVPDDGKISTKPNAPNRDVLPSSSQPKNLQKPAAAAPKISPPPLLKIPPSSTTHEKAPEVEPKSETSATFPENRDQVVKSKISSAPSLATENTTSEDTPRDDAALKKAELTTASSVAELINASSAELTAASNSLIPHIVFPDAKTIQKEETSSSLLDSQTSRKRKANDEDEQEKQPHSDLMKTEHDQILFNALGQWGVTEALAKWIVENDQEKSSSPSFVQIPPLRPVPIDVDLLNSEEVEPRLSYLRAFMTWLESSEGSEWLQHRNRINLQLRVDIRSAEAFWRNQSLSESVASLLAHKDYDSILGHGRFKGSHFNKRNAIVRLSRDLASLWTDHYVSEEYIFCHRLVE